MLIPPAGFSAARVLVVGDVILDRYWFGATNRISPEAPVPVVRVDGREDRPGGAANVALNIAALGARATLIGTVGDDEAGAAVRTLLAKAGVACALATAAGWPTIVKLRVLSQHQQLIRLDFEDAAVGDGERLLERYRAALTDADVVVLSDYAKGSLCRAPEFIALARAAGRPVVVDPKGTDFERYRGATVVTPNLREFEAIAGPVGDDAALAAAARVLRERLDLGAVLVTRGERGMTLVGSAAEPAHFAAQAREVYDVTGAGDTVCAALATGLAAGLDLQHAAALANLAAGIAVGKLGAASVSTAELEHALRTTAGGPQGVVDEDTLVTLVAQARRQGETVVMTNGCFDLLHAGHVHYLQAARRLGDRLVVAVNDDASVRALKGPGRPLVPLPGRMHVLAALAAVDWVVPFAEATPARLIGRVLPDVLVKGGDYRGAEIAGAAAVRRAGGRVEILEFVPGWSTSALVDAARGQGTT